MRYGVAIHVEDKFPAGERADQHQQRRSGQVKVGQHLIDGAKFLARVEKQLRIARTRRDRGASVPCAALPRGVFQRAHDGGAHGENGAVGGPRGVDFVRRRLRDFVLLSVHRVLLHDWRAHRLKRARPDMQSEFADLNASPAKALEDPFRKMESRRGRRYRPRRSGENRLVTLAIRRLVLAMDIRRQRYMAQALESAGQIRGVRKSNPPLTEFAPADHLRLQFPFSEYHPFAHAHLPAGANQRVPHPGLEFARQQHLNRRAKKFPPLAPRRTLRAHPGPAAEQARGNHPGVVQHHQFVAAQEIRQFAKRPVLPRSRPAVEHEHLSGIALGRRMLGNAFRGKLVIEFVYMHRAGNQIVLTAVRVLELGMMTEPNVVINSRGVTRLEAGHLWIFRSDVRSARAAAGDVVRVRDERGRFLGRAFYSDRSQITLRFLTRHDAPVDRAFFAERIRAAAAWRQRIVEDTEAWRVVYGEGDLLPSIIVDRYDQFCVLQTLSQGSERRKTELVEILIEQFSPRGILERNDPKSRLNEGLEQKVSVLHGDVPPEVTASINGLRFDLDLYHGQKTGCFLDQRENQRAAARYSCGEALDCFAYQGGFALMLANRCQTVEAVDISAAAVAAGRRNAEFNGAGNVTFREGNAFDVLKQYDEAGRRFDTIVLDPPAFAKNRDAVPAASRGYKEINLRALKLLRPGGILVTCSCSHHISETTFAEILLEASQDLTVMAEVVERRTQAIDHPILLSVPETYYLKCFILKRL